MAKHITSILLVASLVAVSACATRNNDVATVEEEYIIVEPAPISVEPVYTGKYK